MDIELDSAGFQRGGFAEDDCLDIIRALVDAGIDLVEISGGTFEAPAMTGRQARESARQSSAVGRLQEGLESAPAASFAPLSDPLVIPR